MSETRRGPLGWVGHVVAQVLVGIYVVVDAILGPIFRPLIRWLSRLEFLQAIARGIDALPAYVVLVLLVVPFAVEELAKVYAFVLMGGGHFKSGLLIYIGSHVFAILVCERIFSAGKAKLMTIPWFARFFNWLNGYKERMVAWFKATTTYARMMEAKNRVRQSARLFLRRTKTALGR